MQLWAPVINTTLCNICRNAVWVHHRIGLQRTGAHGRGAVDPHGAAKTRPHSSIRAAAVNKIWREAVVSRASRRASKKTQHATCLVHTNNGLRIVIRDSVRNGPSASIETQQWHQAQVVLTTQKAQSCAPHNKPWKAATIPKLKMELLHSYHCP